MSLFGSRAQRAAVTAGLSIPLPVTDVSTCEGVEVTVEVRVPWVTARRLQPSFSNVCIREHWESFHEPCTVFCNKTF